MEIHRSQARQLRAVFRRLVDRRSASRPPLSLEAGSDGLRVRIHRTEIAAEYRIAGSFPAETLYLPLEALADFEGRQDTVVRLVANSDGGILAHWVDGAVPQSREYPALETAGLAKFPEEPEQTTDLGPEFLKALADARDCAAGESMRYGTDKLQLRGAAGEVIATDGRQLLIQSGFRFPWQEDLLIPNTTLFGARDLSVTSTVTVGRTAAHVMLRTGSWTLHLPIDARSRYPRVEECIPKLSGALTRWHIDPADAAFLVNALPRLPGGEEDSSPVTIDLNGHACVRARAENQGNVTEVVLSRSGISGNPVRLSTNRGFLARAIRLGFTEMCVVNADRPYVCQDKSRRFVVMPLAKESALPPSDDAVHIASEDDATVAPSQTPERRTAPVSTPESNGSSHGNGQAPRKPAAPRKKKDASLAGLIDETQALKELLRDAFGRSHRLLGALKRHKRQSKMVQSTLASLRQLHQIDA